MRKILAVGQSYCQLSTGIRSLLDRNIILIQHFIRLESHNSKYPMPYMSRSSVD